jgi:Tol biopolymer transport system component
MRMSSKTTLVLSALIVLGLLVACAGWLGVRYIADIGRPPAAVSLPPVQAVVDSPLPSPAHPTAEIVVITPPPEGGGIVLEPGKIYVFPSPTPFPTPTPRPTPTRRPGPTATPFPTRQPASGEGSIIIYLASTDSARKVLGKLFITAQGENIAGVISIPSSIDFDPYLIAPSPDGQYLLLMRPMMPGGLPYILNTKDESIRSLLPESSSLPGRFFGWHPDSRQILFWPSNSELWLIDVETSERIILTLVEGSVQGAAISPDGQNVVYISGLRTTEHLNSEALWMVSTAGSDARPLFYFDGRAYVFGWSPNGKHILYMGGPGAGREQVTTEQSISQGPLWIVEPDGRNPRPLAGSFVTGFGYEPAWSPDSQWVAFTGLDEGQEFGCFPQTKESLPQWPECQFQGTGVYIENIGTGEIRRLAPGIAPKWSPDGSTLAFLSDASGAIEIWTVRADGRELRQLTTDKQPKTGISWIGMLGVQK